MSYPLWQPGTLYVPGDIVVPVSQPAPSATAVINGSFAAGDDNWTFTGGAAYVNDGHNWGGAGAVRLPGNQAEGLGLNDTVLVVPVGSSITASCMIEQGAAIAGATRGWVEIHWFDADGVTIRVDKGNAVEDGDSGAWKKSEKTSVAPAGAAYCKAGIALWSVADHSHPIWGDALQVSGTFAGLPAGLAFKAVQSESGMSGGAEPAWPSIVGQTVTDGDVTWEAISGSRVEWTAEPLYLSGSAEPDWPQGEGESVLDGSVTWRAVSRRVEDENCPNTRTVVIAASKVFCADDDIVRYSATVNPLDWSSGNDAGYLPVGLQNYGSNPVKAMGLYRGNLIVFNAEGFQLWQVDEDPANMALIDAMPLGSVHHHALAPVSNDLFFLSSQGVRTVGIAASSTNYQAGDVGMPIDPLVQAAMGASEGVGLYYPAAGQYWLTFDYIPSPTPDDGPTITGDAPSGVVNEAYSYQYTIGTPPGYTPPAPTVEVTQGAIPDGLTLSASGLLSGTPTEADVFDFRLTVTDKNNRKAWLGDTVAITPEPPYQGMTWTKLDVGDEYLHLYGQNVAPLPGGLARFGRGRTTPTTTFWEMDEEVLSQITGPTENLHMLPLVLPASGTNGVMLSNGQPYLRTGSVWTADMAVGPISDNQFFGIRSAVVGFAMIEGEGSSFWYFALNGSINGHVYRARMGVGPWEDIYGTGMDIPGMGGSLYFDMDRGWLILFRAGAPTLILTNPTVNTTWAVVPSGTMVKSGLVWSIIKWHAAGGELPSRFEVKQTVDGQTWATIGWIACAGSDYITWAANIGAVSYWGCDDSSQYAIVDGELLRTNDPVSDEIPEASTMTYPVPYSSPAYPNSIICRSGANDIFVGHSP